MGLGVLRWVADKGQWMPRDLPTRERLNYLVAFLAVSMATALSWHLQPVIESHTNPLFFAAVMIAAWYGGLGPGLAASGLAMAAMVLVFADPTPGPMMTLAGALRMVVFLFVAVLISWLNVARKRIQERLREAYASLETRVAERTAELSTLNGVLQDEVATRRRAQQQLLAQQERLRSLALELSLAEEQERRRIAVQLHDQIGQMLALSQMKLDMLRQTCADGKAKPELDAVRDLVEQTVSRTRSLTGELSPPVLYELGFPAALAWLVERVQKQSGIVIDLEEDDEPKPMSLEVRVLLFQAVRELLTNMVKHSRASKATVRLSRVGAYIRVQVQDYGVGFDPASLATRSAHDNHFGLFSIRERLRRHGGYLETQATPGAGATFSLIMELEHNVAVDKMAAGTADGAVPDQIDTKPVTNQEQPNGNAYTAS